MAATFIVDPPVVSPRKFGLFSVADVQDITDPHMLIDGITWFADNCSFPMLIANDVVCGATPTRTKTGDNRGTVEAIPFQVYVYAECAGINEYRDAQKRATDILAVGTERAVEVRLLQKLQAAGSVQDYTAGTPSLIAAIAAADDLLDSKYAGQGTIFANRYAGALASSTDAVDIHGNHLETSLGTPFFAGQWYGPTGPGSVDAGAGKTWVWATGKITVRLGKMFVSDPMFVQTPNVNEVQTLDIMGTPTGGTYTLTFGGQTTTALAYNANAAAVQAALVALSNVETGDVVVTGTYPNYTLTFGGQYAAEDVPQITATASLTGGSSPSVLADVFDEGANNFGDNSYRVMATRSVIVDWDCFGGGIKATLPV